MANDDVVLTIGARTEKLLADVQEAIRAAEARFGQLSNTEVHIDTTPAVTALEQLEQQLAFLQDVERVLREMPLGLNTEPAIAELQQMKDDLLSFKEEMEAIGRAGLEPLVAALREAQISVAALVEAASAGGQGIGAVLEEGMKRAAVAAETLENRLKDVARVTPVPESISRDLVSLNDLLANAASDIEKFQVRAREAGGSAPLEPLVAHAARVSEVMEELFNRTTLGSDKFGVAVQASINKAGTAIAALERDIDLAREAGDPIPAEAVERLDYARIAFGLLTGEVGKLAGRLKDLKTEGEAPIEGLEASFHQLEVAVQELAERTTVSSAQFGRGLASAISEARLALEGFITEMNEARQNGDPVPPGMVERLNAVRQAYRELADEATRIEAFNKSVRENVNLGVEMRSAAMQANSAVRNFSEAVHKGAMSEDELNSSMKVTSATIEKMEGLLTRFSLAIDNAVPPDVAEILARVRRDFAAASEEAERFRERLQRIGEQRPLDPLVSHADRVQALMTDFFSRVSLESDKFGVGIQGASDKAGLALAALEREIESAREAGSPIPDEVIQRLNSAKDSFLLLSSAASELKLRLQDLRQVNEEPLSRLEVVARRADRALSELAERTDATSESFGKNLISAVAQAKFSLDALSVTIERMRQDGDPIPPEVEARLRILSELYQGLSERAIELEQANKAVRSSFGSVSESSVSLGSSLKASALEIVGLYTAFQTAIGIVEGFTSKVESLIKFSAESAIYFQRLKIGMDVAFGGLQQGGEEMEFVRRNALALGVQLRESAEAYTRLSAAVRNTKLEGDGIKRIFQEFSETLTVLHANQDETNRIFLALREIMDRGVLSAQNFERQLQTIPGIARLGAEALGVTEAEFQKMMRTAAITGDGLYDFLSKLADKMHETFGRGTTDAIVSVQAEMNRLGNAALEAGGQVGEGLGPPLIATMKELRGWLEDNKKVMKDLGFVLGAAITFLGGALRGVIIPLQIAHAAISEVGAIGAKAAEGVALLHSALAKLAHQEALAKSFDELADKADNLAKKLHESVKEDFGKAWHSLADGIKAATTEMELAKKPADTVVDTYAKLEEKIKDGADAIRQYAHDLGETGPVTQAAADKIVGMIRAVIKEVDQLPPAWRKSFESMAREMDGFLGRFYKYTTDYEKALERQEKAAQKTEKTEGESLRKREKNYVDFVRAAMKELEKLEGKTQEQAQAKLKDLEKEQKKLTFKVNPSDDDRDRLKKLPEEIKEAREELEKAKKVADEADKVGSETAVKAGAAIFQQLQKLILENKEFQESFKMLSSSGQEALRNLIVRFAELAKQGGVTRQSFQEFTRQLQEILKAAGVSTDGLGLAFKELAGDPKAAIEGLDTALKAMSSSASTASARGREISVVVSDARDKVTGAGQAMEGTARSAEDMAEGLKHVNEAAAQSAKDSSAAGGGYIKVHDESTHAAGGLGTLKDSYAKIGPAADDAGEGTIRFRDKTVEVNKATEDGVKGFIRFRDTYAAVGQNADTAATSVKKVGDETGKAGKVVAQYSDEQKKLNDAQKSYVDGSKDAVKSLGDVAKGADQAQASTAKLAKSTTDASAPLTAVAESSKRIADSKLGDALGTAADAAGKLADKSKSLSEEEKKLDTIVSTLVTDLPKFKKVVGDGDEELKRFNTTLEATNRLLSAAAKNAKDLEGCLKALGTA